MSTPVKSLQHIRENFLSQAHYCEELGSPFMVRLCELFAQHLDEEEPFAQQLLALPKAEFIWHIALPLRVAGALHALVLKGLCQELARVYPPNHKELSDADLWQAFSHAMEAHADFFIPFLAIAPQTNEVRRCAALLPGFIEIARLTGLPFTLSELGASAGINLCWDSFGYQFDGQKWGDMESGVIMAPEWQGATPPPFTDIEVSNRAACDLSPINYKDPEEKLKLLSYLWADQLDRVTRTENALKILAAKKYSVDKANISAWLPQRLALDTTGTVHVIYHTIVWGYQDEESRDKNQKLIEAAAAKATEKSPLAWLRLEPDGKEPGAAITLTLWPNGKERCLGRADYHGRWINWNG